MKSDIKPRNRLSDKKNPRVDPEYFSLLQDKLNIFDTGYLIRLSAYSLITVAVSLYFRTNFIAGIQTQNVERFSLVFIPLLTLFIHFFLMAFLPFAVYCILLFLDLFFKLGISVYYGYFHNNFDINIIIGNFREGLTFFDYILDIIPIPLLLAGIVILLTQIFIAKSLIANKKATKSMVLILGIIVIPGYALALHKESPKSATQYTEYTLCIKLHGYYAAVISDLIFSGNKPSDEALIAELENEQVQKGKGLGIVISRPHKYRSLIVIQAESLDFNVLDYSRNGIEITPFLNNLSKYSIMIKTDPFHLGGSGSSGADFQLLTGLLPLPNYPIYRIRTLGYEKALPEIFSKSMVESFAFHGNDGSFYNRSFAFREMGFKKFFDVHEFSHIDSKRGVSDSLFFKESLHILNERKASPGFYFFITLSSHGPFDLVENRLFPGKSLTEKYFNAINYVDRALKMFFSGLKGNYLVVIYGDHSAGIGDTEYDSLTEGKEFVPCFIFELSDGSFEKPSVDKIPTDLMSGNYKTAALYDFLTENYP